MFQRLSLNPSSVLVRSTRKMAIEAETPSIGPIGLIKKLFDSIFSASYSDLRSVAVSLNLSRLCIHNRTALRIVHIPFC